MKVSSVAPKFPPITIVLETELEYKNLQYILNEFYKGKYVASTTDFSQALYQNVAKAKEYSQ